MFVYMLVNRHNDNNTTYFVSWDWLVIKKLNTIVLLYFTFMMDFYSHPLPQVSVSDIDTIKVRFSPLLPLRRGGFAEKL